MASHPNYLATAPGGSGRSGCVDPDALTELRTVLQHAFSGELGEAHAYRGHAASVLGAERGEIERIRQEEIDHRERVGRILSALGSSPDRALERRMELIGRTISALCRIGGWFVPMYGAGRLEASNVWEYVHAARAAMACGRADLVNELLGMAEVEWDHEAYFHAKCVTHPLWQIFPAWKRPGARAAIRDGFAMPVVDQTTARPLTVRDRPA